MFDKYKRLTFEQLNAKAELLRVVKDRKALEELAMENGIGFYDTERFFDGELDELADLTEAACGRIRVETREIDIRGSVVECGLYTMFRYVVQYDGEVQRAVMDGDRSAMDCLRTLMTEYTQTVTKLPLRVPETTVIMNLTHSDVKRIVREFYLGEEGKHVI